MTIQRAVVFIFVLLNFTLASKSNQKKQKRESFDFSSPKVDTGLRLIEVTSGQGEEMKSSDFHSFDFYSTDFSNFGTFPVDYSWDVKKESDWTLSPLEFFQHRTKILDKALNSFLGDPKTVTDGTNFDFEVKWPSSPLNEPLPSKVSCSFHVFAFKILFNRGHLTSFRRICSTRLIDLTRPIYHKSTGIYRSFLSMAVECNFKIEEANFDVLLAYSPKSMLDYPDSVGTLPLTAAIRQNSLVIVKKLIAAGANVNKLVGENIRTPFMSAIEYNHNEIVDFLFETGKVNPNIFLPDGTNALSLICTHRPDYCLSYLREFFSGPIKLTAETFNTVLHQLYMAKMPIFKQLVIGVVTEKYPLLRSLLALAYSGVCNNDLDLLIMLYGLNLPLSSYLFSGVTLIHIAAERGFSEIVEFLLQTGSNVNAATAKGETVIQLAYDNTCYEQGH